MFRAAFRPRTGPLCYRSWNFQQQQQQQLPLINCYRRHMNSEGNKWRRKIKISDQIRVVTDRLRISAARTGKRIRKSNSNLQEICHVRFASLTKRPAGVFRRFRGGLIAEARRRRDRGLARIRSQVLLTRRGVRRRVDSARKTVERKTDGYITGLRRQMKRFGLLGIGVYVTLGTLDWITFYYLLKWGVDVNVLLNMLGINKTFNTEEGSATFWTLVGAAYACHKAIMPVRLIVTLVVTRPIWRYLVRLGWIKRPKTIPKVTKKT
ncbi:uncharacterized protein LOC135829772 [Sycon ciliatum]|uniref:uncharacterized protein LOC135829772 n=1 Tax=Sycon ciliatum TaxID=27933 RepID=UPI0020A96CCE|eukprot:scpid82206/ scgid18423/ Protein FAM210B